MNQAKYFFVNKSLWSDQLSHSKGAQRSAIQKHVQNGLARPRKQKRRSREETVILDDRALYNPTIRHLSCRLDAFKTTSINIASTPSNIPSRMLDTRTNFRRMYGQDNTVKFLLHYYIFYYQWTITTNASLSLRRQPDAFRSLVVPVVQSALEDKLAMYCLLTAAVCRVRHHDGLHYPAAAESYFMSEALHLLQEAVDEVQANDCVTNDRLVSCVMFLGVAELFRKNDAAACTHLSALLALVGREGIPKLKDKSVQDQLLLADLVDSSRHLEPCRFITNDDPGPIVLTEQEAYDASDDSGHDLLGSSLLAKDASVLPEELRILVLQILESYRVKCGLKDSTISRSRSYEVTHWVTKRNRAVWKRLLAFETAERKVHVLKVALVMWILLCMTLTAQVRTVKQMASKLKSSMSQIPAGDWTGNDDVRLWVLMMGYQCADDESETFCWYAEQIRRVHGLKKKAIGTVPMPGEGLMQVFIKFQQGFLFHDPAQRLQTQKLVNWLTWWDDVVSL